MITILSGKDKAIQVNAQANWITKFTPIATKRANVVHIVTINIKDGDAVAAIVSNKYLTVIGDCYIKGTTQST